MVDHPPDRQVCNGNDIEPIDEAAAFLMRAVGASVGYPLRHADDNLATFAALRRALRRGK